MKIQIKYRRLSKVKMMRVVALENIFTRSVFGVFLAFVVTVIAGQAASAATPTSLSTGLAHACAVVDGKVKCWGNNGSGQLGNNSTSNSSMPVTVYTRAAWTETTRECTGWVVLGNCVGGSWRDRVTNHPATPLYNKTVTKVSAGQYHTCAVAGARVYCWGNNGNGRLGNNSTSDSSHPVDVTAGALRGKEVIDVSAGDNFTCALATDGTVACWGANNNGQLGTGNRTASRVPVAVSTTAGSALQGSKVKKLAALKGDTATMCVITRDDKAVCWGQNDFGEVGNGRVIPARTSKVTGKAEHTKANRCSYTDPKAKSDAVNDAHLDNVDVLRPAAVSTSLKFSSIDIVAGGAGADSFESGDTKTYVYVTANTISSSENPNKAFYWGGSLSYSLDVKCVVNHDYRDSDHSGAFESTKSTATLELLLSGVSTPRGALYTSEKSNQLRNQQIALISGNASIGSNYVQQCATRTEQYFFTTRDITVCDSPRDGLVCASTIDARDRVACDTGAQTCTDNSDGSAANIAWLKFIGQYRQACATNGPQSVASGGSSWLKPGMNVTAIDAGMGGFTCAIASNTIGCWGEGSKGQLGNGATADSTIPVKVSGI